MHNKHQPVIILTWWGQTPAWWGSSWYHWDSSQDSGGCGHTGSVCQAEQILVKIISWIIFYLVSGGVLADKDEEDEAAPEKVDTSNDPEDKLSGGETLHVPMIPMDEEVDALKYPENPHHSEQLAVQHLQENWFYVVSNSNRRRKNYWVKSK